MTLLTRHTTKILLIGIFTLLLLGYVSYQIRGVVRGPQVQISSPTNGIALLNGHIVITGTSVDIASLQLNGHQIFTDAEGNFKEDLLLLDGYNVIEMRATDKFERTTVKRLDLVLLSPPAAVAAGPTAVAQAQ